MPLIEQSDYDPPRFLRNGHLQTILPSLFRKVDGVVYTRERIETPDGDFLDLDWSRSGSADIGIISHGLEGSSDRSYVRGMVCALNRAGIDALAWNFRGCSGEVNRKVYSYHSGKTDDLHTVISHVLGDESYRKLHLIGFSMGGNVTLKYLGERGAATDPRISRAFALSVPCDLGGSAEALARRTNRIYMNRFLRMLREKVRQKMALFPGEINDEGYDAIRSFKDFDDRYTAPLHGFCDALDYWETSSSVKYLEDIRRPALLVNSLDDPFLSPGCFPRQIARRSDHFFLEMPAHGGHTGFMHFERDGLYWSEVRAVRFLTDDATFPSARSSSHRGSS